MTDKEFDCLKSVLTDHGFKPHFIRTIELDLICKLLTESQAERERIREGSEKR